MCHARRVAATPGASSEWGSPSVTQMSKRTAKARKRAKSKKANHGQKPNRGR